MTSRRRYVLPALTVAAGLALAGCGSTQATLKAGSSATLTLPSESETEQAGSGAPAEGEHNDADVAFVSGMVAHHQQAITLADQALTKSSDESIKQLATTIKDGQQTEADTMKGWLTGWGGSVSQPQEAHGGAEGAAEEGAHGGESTGDDGMLSDAELTRLSDATGAEYDRLWLQAMIRHHEGAVASAQTVLTEGLNPQVKELAQTIVDTQNAEITQMRGIEESLG